MKSKRKFILCIALAYIISLLLFNINIKVNAEQVVPRIVFVGIGHSPIVDGDSTSIILISKNADKVQYKVVLFSNNMKNSEDLLGGYTYAVDAKMPYEFTPNKIFRQGKYVLRVYVKAAGSMKEYDSYYDANINCVSRDDSKRIYANGNMLISTDNYNVGEKIQINGIDKISGIKAPYKYRLHLYNVDKNQWIKNVQWNYDDRIEWIPSEAGTYVLDVHVITPNSTAWTKYSSDPLSTDLYGTYQAWRLKVINVADNFKVISANAVGSNYILVKFSKEVDKYDAELTSKYHIGDMSVANAALQPDKKSVLLTLSSKLSGVNEYTIDPILSESKTTKTQKVTIKETYGDTIKPTINAVPFVSLDNNYMYITFSEDMDYKTALDVNNYKVGGISIFSDAIFDQSGNFVRLKIIPNSINYSGGRKFEISGCRDKAGNLADDYSTIIDFRENCKPYIKSAKLTDANHIQVNFSENMMYTYQSDFEVYIGGIKVDPATVITSSYATPIDNAIITLKSPSKIDDLNKIIQIKYVNTNCTDTAGNHPESQSFIKVSY